MTRILHILDHSLPAHSGYTFRTRAILKAQQALGWQVAGVTGVRQPSKGTLHGQPHDVVDGIDFYRTPAISEWPSPIREWREIAALAARIEDVCDTMRPDILHAHSPVLDALAAARVARIRGLPLVYEIRAFWEDAAVGNGTGREGSVKYRLIRAIERRAVDAADAVVVICDGLRDDLIARGVAAEKITVSPNGVDLSVFGAPPEADRALRGTLGLDGAEVIGFIGSFYDYEGLDDLIAAMPALVAARPNARLLLVGGGPCEAALRAQALASSAAAQIHFAGRVPHDEVERYYALIDVLAYPRKKMRLTDLVTPLKPLEAMAQRRIVAASDIGGHRELIADGFTGTLFKPSDPADIAATLADLLARRGDWEAMRAAGRAFVERERDWSTNILRYDPVYQRLIDAR
jgi:PEP-CTERM/exosortase A-associated glycosyltransferase